MVARYDEDLTRLERARDLLEEALTQERRTDTMITLSYVYFLLGEVRARTDDEKLAAYDRGRDLGKRAVELAPRDEEAHLWYAINMGRWGQTKGVVRSLFLLPEVKRGMETAIELDPRFAPAYVLAGTVYYEVPGLFGGDLEKSEALFRRGLAVDAHHTALRIGLARTLIKRGRPAEARRELQAVLDEKAPSNVADWTMKDVGEARALLATRPAGS
jgi:tetratricopeptide (TPR) repeat protein